MEILNTFFGMPVWFIIALIIITAVGSWVVGRFVFQVLHLIVYCNSYVLWKLANIPGANGSAWRGFWTPDFTRTRMVRFMIEKWVDILLSDTSRVINGDNVWGGVANWRLVVRDKNAPHITKMKYGFLWDNQD